MSVDSAPVRPQAQTLEGWEERWVGEDPRLSELADMCRELGFEVRLEPFKPTIKEGDLCATCFDSSIKPVMVIFTRKEVE